MEYQVTSHHLIHAWVCDVFLQKEILMWKAKSEVVLKYWYLQQAERNSGFTSVRGSLRLRVTIEKLLYISVRKTKGHFLQERVIYWKILLTLSERYKITKLSCVLNPSLWFNSYWFCLDNRRLNTLMIKYYCKYSNASWMEDIKPLTFY